MAKDANENHNLPTLLRLIAITLIVSSHFELFDYGGGGAYFLLILVGYNIATFKISRVLATDSVKPVTIMIVRVAIPTVLYTLLLNLALGPFHWQSVLLISNLFPENHPKGFGYWFIEVYIQLQLIALVVLSSAYVRHYCREHIKTAALVLVLFSSVLCALSAALWDADAYFRRLPWLMLWMFAFGFAARFAVKPLEKIALLIGMAFMLWMWDRFETLNSYVWLSYALLVFRPPLKLPRRLAQAIYFIASGSLFIYLTHFQWQSLTEKFIPDQPLLHTLLALVMGASLFHIYNTLVNKRLLGFLTQHTKTRAS